MTGGGGGRRTRSWPRRIGDCKAVIQRLEAQVAELEQLVEKLRREGKRQAAPFRKQDQPAADPKKPGRKSGRRHGPHAQRAVPPRIDETYDVPLPPECPHCGEHRVRETHVAAHTKPRFLGR